MGVPDRRNNSNVLINGCAYLQREPFNSQVNKRRIFISYLKVGTSSIDLKTQLFYTSYMQRFEPQRFNHESRVRILARFLYLGVNTSITITWKDD